MTTELAVPARPSDKEYLDSLSGNFLQNLILVSGMSELSTTGKVPPGNYAYGDRNVGNKVPIVICHNRYHALLLDNKQKAVESFNFGSSISKKIRETRTDYTKGIDSRHGYSYLVWILGIEKFAVFHPSSWSARRATASLVTITKPLEERESQFRDLPFSNFVTLVVDTAKNKNQITYIIPGFIIHEEHPPKSPTKEEFEAALRMFIEPELAEQRQVVSTDGVEAR